MIKIFLRYLIYFGHRVTYGYYFINGKSKNEWIPSINVGAILSEVLLLLRLMRILLGPGTGKKCLFYIKGKF